MTKSSTPPVRRGRRKGSLSRLAARRITLMAALVLGFSLIAGGAIPASAASYIRISGSGSSWAGNALAQWVSDVRNQGVTVGFSPTGSSQGRKDFSTGLSSFAISEIPYEGDTADPQDTSRPAFGYNMLPVVAGGTSFMYNLPVGGQRLKSLKLSMSTIAGIFSGQITNWNDPALAADNPDIQLPDHRIVVVVRSEGSGATAQFTLWMLRQYPELYAKLCQVTGCDAGHATSYFPYQNLTNFVAQNGSNGVTTYTTDNEYTINYDEYSYAQQVNFPVANVKNAAGFYTVPDQFAVAVALTQASINTDPNDINYLAQDLTNVYGYLDPRAYPLSAYSYMLAPTETYQNVITPAVGATLGYFTQYALCEGQRKMGQLGYSPLPMNLVLAAMEQIRKVPGIDADTTAKLDATAAGVLTGGADPCNNPTFKAGDDPSHNVLVDTAPFPAGCDEACQAVWKKPGSGVNSGPTFDQESSGGGGGDTTGDAPSDDAGDPSDTPTDAAGGAGGGGGNSVCDADTGICTDGGTADAAGVGNAKAIPTVIAGSEGWAGPQTLMVLGGILVLVLFCGPPVANRILGRKRTVGGGR